MFAWVKIIQILIIIITVGLFYRAFIKNTSSEQLVHGLFGLGMLWISSFVMTWLHLDLLAGFLYGASLFLSVGLIVIFAPELRRFLALLGDIKIVRTFFSKSSFRTAAQNSEIDIAINEILKSVDYMSKKNTGALIVFQDSMDINENNGVAIDAKISNELLLTIFFNKTPLHDGAMIIIKNRVAYAGAILPLTKNADLNWKYGTRHRAAIGKSESSPKSAVLVVSEETGDISVAQKGVLKKYDDMKKLKARLEKIIKTDI